ncbi:hypothetical protein [Burkholderia metallica]
MTLGISGLVVMFLMLLVTYLAFGRRARKTFFEEFVYWLKSTLTSAIALFSWLSFNDVDMQNWIWIFISFALSGVFCFGRGIALAML